MKLSRILALGAVAALAALTLDRFADAQSAPGAYGPAGTAITPLYANQRGGYAKALVSGTMAAGLASGSPVYSFRYGGTGVAVIRGVCLSAVNAGTAFTAGVAHLDLFAARAFTASDTGGTAGTLTTNNGKLRTSTPTTAVSDIRISSTATLSAGTRTLDTDPLTSTVIPIPATTTNYTLLNPTCIYAPVQGGDQPLVLAPNEGFVIQATVPATGTWTFEVETDWEELSSY